MLKFDEAELNASWKGEKWKGLQISHFPKVLNEIITIDAHANAFAMTHMRKTPLREKNAIIETKD